MLTNDTHAFHDFLDRDEKLLWTGKPKSGFIFRKTDIFIIPFSLFWCGFSAFWIFMAAKGSAVFALFGLPFLFIGIMLLFGRFFIEKKQREKTIYGITEDRIIIISGILSTKVNSVSLKNISNLEFTENADGSGSIHFGPKDPRDPFGMMQGMTWMPGVKPVPALTNIENVRSAYRILAKLQ